MSSFFIHSNLLFVQTSTSTANYAKRLGGVSLNSTALKTHSVQDGGSLKKALTSTFFLRRGLKIKHQVLPVVLPTPSCPLVWCVKLANSSKKVTVVSVLNRLNFATGYPAAIVKLVET